MYHQKLDTKIYLTLKNNVNNALLLIPNSKILNQYILQIIIEICHQT